MTISVAIVTDCDSKDISIAPSNVAAVRIVYFFCVGSLYVDEVVSLCRTLTRLRPLSVRKQRLL